MKTKNAKAPAQAAGATPLRVLIVEDHPIIALTMQTTIEALGHLVVGAAADGPAVCPHDRAELDLALVDVNLANGPTGPAIAEYLSDGGVTVVFHTSDVERIPADFGHALGVLEKPSTPTALAQVVQFVRSGGAGLQPPLALRLLDGHA